MIGFVKSLSPRYLALAMSSRSGEAPAPLTLSDHAPRIKPARSQRCASANALLASSSQQMFHTAWASSLPRTCSHSAEFDHASAKKQLVPLMPSLAFNAAASYDFCLVSLTDFALSLTVCAACFSASLRGGAEHGRVPA